METSHRRDGTWQFIGFIRLEKTEGAGVGLDGAIKGCRYDGCELSCFRYSSDWW